MENNTKHRQGEWKTSKPYFNYYVTCNGESICQINASDDEEANAKLIAAAPDLLEALKLLKQEYQDYQLATGNKNGLNNTKAEEIAIAAIKKATE